MEDRVASYCTVAAFLMTLLSLVTAFAQNGAPTAKPTPEQDTSPNPLQSAPKSWCSGCSADGKTTPRTRDGHPDLSGFYNWPRNFYVGDPKQQTGREVLIRTEDGSVIDLRGGEGGGETSGAPATSQTQRDVNCATCDNPPYKPEYMAKVKEIADAQYGDASPFDPQYDCKPLGIPRGALRGSNDPAMQIVQNAQVVAFLYEDRPGPYFRIVYMDGRPHPDDLDESYFGDSIGHWDGDTLVVDVVGLNDETWLGSGTIGPKYAMMHSNKEHVIERWTRNGDTLTYQATVEDPVVFTKPWVMTPRTTQIAPGDAISPQMCVPFDKNHLVKKDGSTYVDNGGKSAATLVAAEAASRGNAKLEGIWSVTIRGAMDGPLREQWTFQQNGNKITGAVKNAKGELPLEGTVTGAVLNAVVTDGDAKYDVVGTVSDDKEMDGTIKMGRREFLLSAKRTQ